MISQTCVHGAGRLTGVTDARSALAWSYDAPGRVTGRSQIVDTVTLDVAYGYDAYGRLSTLTTPSGQVIGYSYGNGRVTSLTVNGATLLSQVSYRPFGPVTGWQWGNGTTTSRSYDTDGRLSGIVSAGTTSYAYFLDGQIRSTSGDLEFSPVLAEGSTLFTVDTASNRVQSSSGLETRSYSYDAAGNTLSDGTRTYSYNGSGRLATAAYQGVTTSYVYSGLGERVKKSNAGVTRYFAYDEAGQLLGEYDGQGGLVQETVWFGSIPVATLVPDGAGGIDIYYVHTDHLNTPRRVTRPADNVVVWQWRSTPYGAIDADEDPDGDQVAFTYNLRFPGQYRDEETGLYYNYFRTYDPSTGRYLESDPIGLAAGTNTYGYVGGNPLLGIDPLGLDTLVISNGQTYTHGGGNPFGHTAIATTGSGVYSYGNNTAPGSSVADYLNRELGRRDTTLTIIKTTAEQEKAIMEFLKSLVDKPLTNEFPDYLEDNCAVRTSDSLAAGGLPLVRWNPRGGGARISSPTLPLAVQEQAEFWRERLGGQSIEVPKNSDLSGILPTVQQFEPN